MAKPKTTTKKERGDSSPSSSRRRHDVSFLQHSRGKLVALFHWATHFRLAFLTSLLFSSLSVPSPLLPPKRRRRLRRGSSRCGFFSFFLYLRFPKADPNSPAIYYWNLSSPPPPPPRRPRLARNRRNQSPPNRRPPKSHRSFPKPKSFPPALNWFPIRFLCFFLLGPYLYVCVT